MRIGAVILAAGAGTRLGGVAKALLAASPGQTFLGAILAAARAAGLAEGGAIVVVGPPYGQEVAAHARALGARVVENPAPERGMASSVALGFAALAGAPFDAAWLWPVDHPRVSADALRELAAVLGHHAVARPLVEGRRGHPPLVAARLWPELATCDGLPNGARDVLGAHDVDAIEVPIDDSGCLRDFDTKRDLESL